MTQENERANASSTLETPNASSTLETPNAPSVLEPSAVEAQDQIPQQDGGTETTKQPVDDIMAKIWSAEASADDNSPQSEDTAVPEDFKVNYPEGMPEEYASEFDKMFAQHKIPSEKAQQIIDMMLDITDKQEKADKDNLLKQAREDTQRLKAEFGSGFARKDANVNRFIDRSGLEKEGVASLAYAVGKYEAWKLLEKLSVFTAEGEGVSANPRNAGSNGSLSQPPSNDFMKAPQFYDRLKAGDKEAKSQMDAYALAMAKLPQPEVL